MPHPVTFPTAELQTAGATTGDQADTDQERDEGEQASGRRVVAGFRIAH